MLNSLALDVPSLIALAGEVNCAEYGSQEAIDLENRFFDNALPYLSEAQRSEFHTYALKATREEAMVFVLERLPGGCK